MPDNVSTDGDTLIIDMIRRFSQERLAPLAAEREKNRRIEPEIIAELGELGVFGATTPAEWDGSEIDPVTYALLLEEISAGDGSVSTMVSVHNSPTCIVVNNYGTDAHCKRRDLRCRSHQDTLRISIHTPARGVTENGKVVDPRGRFQSTRLQEA